MLNVMIVLICAAYFWAGYVLFCLAFKTFWGIDIKMGNVVIKFATAFSGSMLAVEATQANALESALITFGISLITIVGGELIKLLVAYIKKKRAELGDKGEDNNGNNN